MRRWRLHETTSPRRARQDRDTPSTQHTQAASKEDDKIAATWRNLWKDIEKIRQHGKLIMNNEVHRRKRNVQTKIKKAKEALDKDKNDVKMLDKLEIVKSVLKISRPAMPSIFIDSVSEEAEELEQEATKALDDKKLEVRQFESQLAVAKTHAKMPRKWP